jgi:hypothetical protein
MKKTIKERIKELKSKSVEKLSWTDTLKLMILNPWFSFCLVIVVLRLLSFTI